MSSTVVSSNKRTTWSRELPRIFALALAVILVSCEKEPHVSAARKSKEAAIDTSCIEALLRMTVSDHIDQAVVSRLERAEEQASRIRDYHERSSVLTSISAAWSELDASRSRAALDCAVADARVSGGRHSTAHHQKRFFALLAAASNTVPHDKSLANSLFAEAEEVLSELGARKDEMRALYAVAFSKLNRRAAIRMVKELGEASRFHAVMSMALPFCEAGDYEAAGELAQLLQNKKLRDAAIAWTAMKQVENRTPSIQTRNIAALGFNAATDIIALGQKQWSLVIHGVAAAMAHDVDPAEGSQLIDLAIQGAQSLNYPGGRISGLARAWVKKDRGKARSMFRKALSIIEKQPKSRQRYHDMIHVACGVRALDSAHANRLVVEVEKALDGRTSLSAVDQAKLWVELANYYRKRP